QTGAAVDGVVRQSPHALEVGGATDIRHGHIAETLHQPAVSRDFGVRFEFPAADILRNGAVQNEGIEDIDVIDHEKTGAPGVETRRTVNFYADAGQKDDAAAKTPLEPVVLAGIQKDAEEHESRRREEEMEDADEPEKRTAQREEGAPHM